MAYFLYCQHLCVKIVFQLSDLRGNRLFQSLVHWIIGQIEEKLWFKSKAQWFLYCECLSNTNLVVIVVGQTLPIKPHPPPLKHVVPVWKKGESVKVMSWSEILFRGPLTPSGGMKSINATLKHFHFRLLETLRFVLGLIWYILPFSSNRALFVLV